VSSPNRTIIRNAPRTGKSFIRRHGDSELLVLANFSGTAATIEIPDADRWHGTELILANVRVPEALKARLTLQPWEARVHRRR
jgi:oligo-1,6-glucosidase